MKSARLLVAILPLVPGVAAVDLARAAGAPEQSQDAGEVYTRAIVRSISRADGDPRRAAMRALQGMQMTERAASDPDLGP